MSLFKDSVKIFNERYSIEKSEEIIEKINFLRGGISKNFHLNILNETTVQQNFKNKYGRSDSFFKDFYFTWCLKEDNWNIDVISNEILDEVLLKMENENEKIIIDKIELDDINLILYVNANSKLIVNNPSELCFSNYIFKTQSKNKLYI